MRSVAPVRADYPRQPRFAALIHEGRSTRKAGVLPNGVGGSVSFRFGRIVRDSEKGSAEFPCAVLIPSLDQKRANHETRSAPEPDNDTGIH